MKKDGLKKNFLYQAIYQILILIIPLIISPFLTRRLGGNALGIYTYTNSIAFYFLLTCNLGIAKYGQRIIVEARDNYTKLRSAFWSLFYCHVIVSICTLIVYIAFIAVFAKSNYEIYLIHTLYVASALFDITWLFYGLENFKSVVLKNSIIKIVECILIFSLIKNAQDLSVYTIIVSGGLLFGQFVMLPQAIKLLPPKKVSFKDTIKHLKPMLILFVSVIASTLYTVFDKTLLGLISPSINDVAYYEYASKIVQVPRSLLLVIVTVMFPRACEAVEKSDSTLHKKYIQQSMLFVFILGAPCVTGLMAVSNKLALVYYGSEFSVCGGIISSLAPLILIVYIAEVLRTEYLVAIKNDYLYIIGIILSAIINIILSSLLIPSYGVYGAVIGTFSAELVGLIYVLCVCRNVYSIKELLRLSFPFIITSVLMGIVVRIIDGEFPSNIISLCLEILIGGIMYVILIIPLILFVYKDLSSFICKLIRRKKNG